MKFTTARSRGTKALCGCACLLAAFSASAASPWRFWTKADGLRESVTFGLTADGAGHVIVKAGDVSTLTILDGYGIREIPTPRVYGRILSSPDENLWTFDSQGIDVHDGSGWHAYPIPAIQNFAANSLMLQTPWFTYSVFHGNEDRIDLVPASSGNAILLFPDRLVEWSRATGGTRTIRRASETGLKRFRDIQSGSDGLWITGDTGIARMRLAGGRLEWLETPGLAGNRNFIYPFEGDNRELFVTATRADEKRAVLRLENGRWEEVYAADLPIVRLKGWRGPGGNIWVQRDRKILQLNSEGRALLQNDGKAIAGLTTAVLKQADRTFWLGTTAGVARYALPLWRTPPEVAWADDATSAITEDARGRVWFVSGQFVIVEDRGVWRRFRIPAGAGQPTLTDNIVALNDGRMAILASSQPNLLLLDPESGRFEEVKHPEGRRAGWFIRRRAGGLWIQTAAKDGAGPRIEIFDGEKFTPTPLPDSTKFSELKALLETRNGDLWLATTKIAARIHDGRLKTFGTADGFLDTGVFSLIEASDGRVLLGGRDSITAFDGKHFRKIHDIDLAESISIDARGEIWAASGSGLHRYKPGQWITNSVEEGLSAAAVRKVFVDSRGRVWAGTGQGINLYFPLADTDPPTTRIIEDRNLRETPPGGKVRLTFSGMDKWKFTPPDRLLFSWRVDNAPWSDFASAEFASFDRVKGGHHRFEARAMDRNGNIDPKPAVYEFSVLFPWYQQSEFLLLALLAVVVILILIRIVWRHHSRLRYQSVHDPLTGLVNRTVFDLKLQEALNIARAYDAQVAVVLLDLDRFKAINDTLGHAVGDRFLVEVSSRLRATVRRQDTLARLGGDEFAIVMPNLRDREEAETAARDLLAALRRPYHIETFELRGSASIGVSLFPEHGRDTTTLQRLADMAMYQCKARSKDEYVIFDKESGGLDFHAAHIIALIQESLEHRYFDLHYQPVRCFDGELAGFEALIRLNHPRLGSLPPDDFIGIAEHTGLIVRVGEWVLREACRQTARWHREGRTGNHGDPLHINVNVSTVQLMKSDYAATVLAVLEETGLDPAALTLEITETQMMLNIRDSESQISQLRALGVTIALDDFGTGYSTLSSLDSLDIDYLKIDRSFVQRLDDDEYESLAVIEAITTLAHKFGLKIVAEGVETASQLEALRNADCDFFQGFHLGRPGNAGEAERLLQARAGVLVHDFANPVT